MSVVDVISALTDSAEPRKYWSVLKSRLKKEGSEVTTNCSQLKMLAPDGKMRLRDAMTTRDIFRLIESVPSSKAELFKVWLANLGSERIDEVFDPKFLLELGREFSFVANQQRIKIGSEYYYPDLVFYNRLAKCFVIIDLKIGKLTHQDIGQMQMYVNYYKKTQMIEWENEPIGILLCADKDDAVVEMTLGDSVKNVYDSKYLTYMPSKEELIKIIKDEKELYELAQENEKE